MSAVPNRFAPRSDEDLLRLVLEHPLSWIVSSAGDEFRATLLPLRPVADTHGRITTLVGHFARSNDHVELLKRSPRAWVLVLGVQGYISPSWFHDRTQAPTWNYASAQFAADFRFFEDAPRIGAHLRDLVDSQEASQAEPWSVDAMGERFASLSRGVIGFTAAVREVRAKFKLGQDERDDVFRDIVVGLRHTGAEDLLCWMKQFNSGRDE